LFFCYLIFVSSQLIGAGWVFLACEGGLRMQYRTFILTIQDGKSGKYGCKTHLADDRQVGF
jgi:hypothetical protein